MVELPPNRMHGAPRPGNGPDLSKHVGSGAFRRALVPVVVVVMVWAGARVPGAARTVPVALGLPGSGPGQVAPGIAGSENCAECHAEQYAAWAGSTHGTAGGPPGPETVIAPFGGPPIRFADAVVSPVVDGQGRYLFVVERQGRPPERFEVSGVIGQGHMVGGGTQGYASRFPDGTQRFLPFDYSKDADTWFCNTAFVGGFWVPGADRAGLRADAGWLPVTADMRLTDCGDWPPVRILGTSARFANCQNCHGSQVEVEYRPELERYETRFTTLRINCESCHGPARGHVEWARDVARAPGGTRLAALDTLGPDASLNVCFQCHALKRSLGEVPATPPAAAGDPDPA
ncbi:MAG: hypothetical protein F4237_13235, partial [Gemmatimonadetes bacterium]|nr:hypothetical protein [Gemmatimonadota bacterium]